MNLKMESHRNLFQIVRRKSPSSWHPLIERLKRGRLPAWFLLLLFALTIRLVSISLCQLSGPDEPRVAGIAREMAVRGSYLIPRLNGGDFLEYPPLGYWPISFFLSMSPGAIDFLAFLPIALIGTGTILITFLIGKEMVGPRIGLAAGFILSTMSGFFILHRRCLVDPTLLFFITLSLFGFVKGHLAPRKNARFLALFYLAMAGGFLTKGLIGVGIPAATAVAFLTATGGLRRIGSLHLGWGILLLLLPISLWAGGVWWAKGPGPLWQVIWQSLWRFSSSAADHSQPFHFYLLPALLNLLPWTPFPLILLWMQKRPIRTEGGCPEALLVIFALSWFLSALIGLSIASAKRVLYLGPIFPPFALLSALAWDRVRERWPSVKYREAPALIVLLLIFVAIHFFQLLPMERRNSLQSVFKVVSSRFDRGSIFLYNPTEATRGAAFFYLGKTVPVLKNRERLEGFQNNPGAALVVNLFHPNDPLRQSFESMGFHILAEARVGKMRVLIFSNHS